MRYYLFLEKTVNQSSLDVHISNQILLYIDKPFSSNKGRNTVNLWTGPWWPPIMLNSGFAALGQSQSASIYLPGHLQSMPVFLTMVEYDKAPQRESEGEKSLDCTHLSLLILLNDAVVPQAHNQIFSHMSGAALVSFVDCFLCHQIYLHLSQWNRGKKL